MVRILHAALAALLVCAVAAGDARAASVAAAACSASPGGSQAYPYYCEHGRPAGQATRGRIVVVHGGAWSGVGPAAVARLRPAARRFRRLSFETFNIDYARGSGGLDSLLAIHSLLRRDGDGPVCFYGESAGGHLALLAAARRRFACAIAVAAPTDIVATAGEPPGASWLGDVARATFGGAPGGLAAWCPLTLASRIAERVLLGASLADPIVPFTHASRLDAALGHGRLVALRPGAAPFIHDSVTRADLVRLRAAERQLLDRVVRQRLVRSAATAASTRSGSWRIWSRVKRRTR